MINPFPFPGLLRRILGRHRQEMPVPCLQRDVDLGPQTLFVVAQSLQNQLRHMSHVTAELHLQLLGNYELHQFFFEANISLETIDGAMKVSIAKNK